MKREELYKQLNEGILKEKLYSFDRNLSKNISLIKKWGGLAPVIKKFSGKHVVIVAAGESLNKHIPLLKKIRQRQDVIIFSVDMAFAVLVKHGIFPSFCITCETTPREFFAGFDTSKTELIAFSCSSHSNIRNWQGPMHFYNWMIQREPYLSLWNRAGTDLGYVATGSVVTTQALSIVLGLLTVSTALIGNDLGFRDLLYCPGVIWYDAVNTKTNRTSPLETYSKNAVRNSAHYELMRGERKYFTNNQFLGAKYWIEDLLAKGQYNLLDLSIPGIAEKYVKKMTQKQFELAIFQGNKRKRRRR